MDMTRRDLLMKTLFGGGLWGLRALATGIPVSFFLDPHKAVAQAAPAKPAQYVILSTSELGDPVNANVPGMYADSGIVHPTDSAMAPTQLTVGSTTTTAAAPWAGLPQSVLNRTCFFHHGTYTVVHPDEWNVLRLMGSTAQAEMLPSLLAKQLGPQLGTIQVEPVVLGTESINFNGHAQPNISPTALAQTLAGPSGPLGQLQSLRDRYLDEINATVRREGNSAQQAFIDKYVVSQQQARLISQNLLETLAPLSKLPDDQDTQVTAAIVLIQMNVAPVLTIHIAFGGDNHTDVGLANETSQTVAGVGTIASLMQQLSAAGLEDRVTFATLNVFGRTLAESNITGLNGRTHHGDHHCAVLIGKPFAGGVVGGVELNSATQDYRAMSIDSQTGAGVANGGGDIQFGSTLNAMAMTLGVAAGADPTYLSQNISGGTVVPAALAT